MDHYFDLSQILLQQDISGKETLSSKIAFEHQRPNTEWLYINITQTLEIFR